MPSLVKERFICLDCESTGLDAQKDMIIEIAVVIFDMEQIYEKVEFLINPGILISEESMAIHNITDAMVQNQPTIDAVLPGLLKMIGNHIIVGHGVWFDMELMAYAAERASIPCKIRSNQYIDTLRLARLYGESPQNSLEQLCKHFNIPFEGAHRAMADVIMNVEVFKFLSQKFTTTEQIFKVLSKPILLKEIPFGKHKGRPMKEVPIDYLHWAANKDFDQDLLFTIRTEINRRKKGNQFSQVANPFQGL